MTGPYDVPAGAHVALYLGGTDRAIIEGTMVAMNLHTIVLAAPIARNEENCEYDRLLVDRSRVAFYGWSEPT